MERPDPRSLLEKIKEEEEKLKRGQLKVFFGYAAGVGKTYSMLESAQNLKKAGVDVVVGYIEPHTRPETLALLDGLEILPVKNIKYKTINLKEFDLDAALKRNPKLILVDEFAHTNVKGLRHNKRWQDIEELLLAGIDVYTTVNVQHLESLNDIVEIITKISVKETIPDRLLDNSTQLELIDIEPDVLLQRFNEGKIYKKDQALKAKDNFFVKDNLIALREIALRKTAERVNKEVQISRLSKGEVTVIPTSDTIMACVGPSPSSTKIIRTASRIADSSLSKWIALYITTSGAENLNEIQKKQLKSNLDLAKKLGAEIVLLHGDDLVEQIMRYAKMRNVTKIVIGKNHSNHNIITKILKKDVVDRLIEEVDHIDVHIIPYKSETKFNYKYKREDRVQSKFKITYIDFVKLSIVAILCTTIAYTLKNIGFANENILLIYMLNVVFVSVWSKGYASGFISSILNIILINYFFTEPLHTFSIDDPNYIITLLVFCIVGIITSTLTSRIQHQAETYSKREENTQMLYQISRSFLRVSSKDDIINKGLELLFISLNRDVVCYSRSNTESELILFEKNRNTLNQLINNDEKAVASWVMSNATIAGNSTDTLPGAKGYYMPIIGINATLGVIGISCLENELDNEDICVTESIVAQMAIALDRERLSQIKESAKNELEKERFISSLLRAISHDIRTPLAGISGTLSTIIKNKEDINDSLLYELIDGAYEDSQWLIRLVENLLSMTRIDENKLKLKKELELVEEVISCSLNHIKRRVENIDIEINIPDDPMFVPMDAKLIEQVLINIIDNAIKYSGEKCKIKINVYEENNQAQFEICDNGPGIQNNNIKHIFDRFFTGETKYSDSRKGVGLGLPICKSIIEAHKGEIYAINNKQKGATFRFILPMYHEED